ncbi:uncharacterized protein LOC119659006 [Hermetia illucens]|uniref:uncharacterized protein LOC119659006 n=1 Tax=Hermetia illucens TaxID=343691 RepID=UPI0018CC16B1|nr:uncharacterized protein LOC119659006 [Hermetia illucens]
MSICGLIWLEAARVIQHMDTNNDNYEAAMELLRERFDKKRTIAGNYLRKFYKLPTAREERNPSIRQYMDVAAEFLANMSSIGISTELWDILVIYAITQKSDREFRQLWESSIEADSDIPSLDNLMEFLTSRFRTLEALKLQQKPQKVDTLTVQDTKVCIFCEKSYYVNQCDAFKALNMQQRRDSVKKYRLYFNCLKKGHVLSKCPFASRCRTCSKPHHTLLHNNGHRPASYQPTHHHLFQPPIR